MPEKKVVSLIGGGIFLAVLIALLCTSFSDVHFYEMGFIRSKTTRQVDTSIAFTSGRFWIGPDKEFKIFDRTAHHLLFDDTSVFTSSDKLEILIDMDIYYFLIEGDLRELHDEHDISYPGVVQRTALAALKSVASKYNLEFYYKQRQAVEAAIAEGIKERLTGPCACRPDCPTSNCDSPCVRRSECELSQRGLFVDVKYVHLTDVRIPADVEERNLRALILTEETAKETYTQQAAIVTKETERQVQEIQNTANEVLADAMANATLITAESQASYTQRLEQARREGLSLLFDSLNFSAEGYKASFDYLRSLGDHSGARITVGFDQVIVGPTNIP